MDNLNEDIVCSTCEKNYTYDSPCPLSVSHLSYLRTLSFASVYDKLLKLASLTKTKDICFTVYEKDYRSCGEAIAVIKWFKENNVEVKDFEQSELFNVNSNTNFKSLNKNLKTKPKKLMKCLN